MKKLKAFLHYAKRDRKQTPVKLSSKAIIALHHRNHQIVDATAGDFLYHSNLHSEVDKFLAPNTHWMCYTNTKDVRMIEILRGATPDDS